MAASGGGDTDLVRFQRIAFRAIGQPYRLELNLLALSMWLWGGMPYIWLMSLIFYRYAFFRFSPGDLSPPYWLNLGAMAISTLAGSLLILNAPHAPYLASLLPFLKGFTLLYWATGTWWIPMLLLGVWRYGFERFPFRYDPLYWGAVFPLGMYAASTWQMDHAMEFRFLPAARVPLDRTGGMGDHVPRHVAYPRARLAAKPEIMFESAACRRRLLKAHAGLQFRAVARPQAHGALAPVGRGFATHKWSATKSCIANSVWRMPYACGSSPTISVPLVAPVTSCRCRY